jgi:Flp pilus assembly pilin Flp
VKDVKRIFKSFCNNRGGHILVEAMIALVVVGAVTFLIINNDIMPGLKSKWDIMNNTIQNNWIN